MRSRPLLALFTAATSVAAHASILTNGSFETLNGNGGAVGWSFTGDALAFAANAYVTNAGGTGVSPDGTNLASFNAGEQPTPGTISQSFSTVSGQSYILSFDYGQFGGGVGNQMLTYSVSAGMVTLTGGSLTPTSPTTNLSSIFQSFTTTFVGTGSTVTLAFTDVGTTSPSNNDLLLDNVSVAAPGPLAAIPFALGMLRRRRKASPAPR